MPTQQLGFHFWILINRMLLLLERVLLHAAAVHYEDRLNLFSGHRGAGKSTLSIALAQSGGTLLAEDHVILRRTAGEFLVSGCTSRMRVTAETERGLLERPLELAAVDVGGTLKKEFPAEEFFASRPYEDRKPDRLFLTRVGEAFSCRPLPPREALLRMVDTTGVMLRFANREDYASFLEFLAAFVKTVTTYELVLSPDISRVREMTGVLRELSEKEASDGAH